MEQEETIVLDAVSAREKKMNRCKMNQNISMPHIISGIHFFS